MDLAKTLDESEVKAELDREIAAIMSAIFDSPAYKAMIGHRLSGKGHLET